MGHSVVGVEISEKACKQFFEENNMTYSEEPVPTIPGAKLFKVGEQYMCVNTCLLFICSHRTSGSIFLMSTELRGKYLTISM